MVSEDHSDNERGNPLSPLHGLLFPISSNVFCYAPSHTQDSIYHGHCYTSRGAPAGTSNQVLRMLAVDSVPYKIVF